jgi:hypothetical protein
MLKTNRSIWKLALLSLAATVMFSACSDDDPEPENEPEIITRMELRFVNQADPTNVVLAEFNDPDGPGGQEPTLTNPSLRSGATYIVDIRLWNDLENEEITPEIKDEDDEHQFFFLFTNNIFTGFEYLDFDADGLPLGLRTRFTTASQARSGTLRVVLRHEPQKNATGDLTTAGGDTDIDVTFNVTIQ